MSTTTTILGKVCVTPKGLHSLTSTYEILDIVSDNNNGSYIAKSSVPAGTPLSNTTYWQSLVNVPQEYIKNITIEDGKITFTYGTGTTTDYDPTVSDFENDANYINNTEATALISTHNTTLNAHTAQFNSKQDLITTDNKLSYNLLSDTPNIQDIAESIVSTHNSSATAHSNQFNTVNQRLDSLSSIGRFLSIWDASTGLPETNPVLPEGEQDYYYKNGDYYVIGKEGTLIPNGNKYTLNIPSTTRSQTTVKINSIYRYDGNSWVYIESQGKTVTWGSIEGTLSNQTDLANALNTKISKIANATTSNFAALNQDGSLYDSDYNSSDFATSAEGLLARNSIQGVKRNNVLVIPDDTHIVNINVPTKTSDLTNDSGFLTEHQSLAAYRTSAAQDVIDATKASASDVDAIEAKIPAQATAQNQLADKNFVNSSIATNTATFKGTYDATDNGWTKIIYKENFNQWNHGQMMVNLNIGLITWERVSGGKKVTVKDVEGNTVLQHTFEYEESANQYKAFTYIGPSTDNIDARVHFYDDGVEFSYWEIEINGEDYVSEIDYGAWELPDGINYQAIDGLTAYDNNDYMNFIVTEGNDRKYKRYKYTGSDWQYEWDINTSNYTAAQWEAINSGITSSLVTAFGAKYNKPASGIPASDLASGVIPDVSGFASKVASATNGNFAGLDSNGNLTDSGKKPSDFISSEGFALQVDVDAINVDNIGDAHSKSIDIDELPKVCGFPMFLFGTTAPSITPDFIGQIYIDTQNQKVYIATGVVNASSFKVLN